MTTQDDMMIDQSAMIKARESELKAMYARSNAISRASEAWEQDMMKGTREPQREPQFKSKNLFNVLGLYDPLYQK